MARWEWDTEKIARQLRGDERSASYRARAWNALSRKMANYFGTHILDCFDSARLAEELTYRGIEPKKLEGETFYMSGERVVLEPGAPPIKVLIVFAINRQQHTLIAHRLYCSSLIRKKELL